MDDIEERIRQEIEWLQRMLDTASDQIQQVADRMANGAIANYPHDYKNDELFQRQQQLTEKVDKIIGKMQALHNEMVKLPRQS